MNAQTTIMILREILSTLPAALTTGVQVVEFVNGSYRSLVSAVQDKDVTAKEISALVKTICDNHRLVETLE